MSSGYSMDGSEEEEDYFDDFEDDSVEDSKTPIINNKSLETKESKNDPKPQPQRQEQTKNKTVKKTNFQSSPSKNRVTSNNYGSSDATKKKKNKTTTNSNTNVSSTNNNNKSVTKKPITKNSNNNKNRRNNSNNQQPTIEKLRLANAALRNQLKEFARALDASIKNNNNAATQGLEPSNKSLAVKEKMLKNMKQKIEIYKKTNKELNRQLKDARSHDRVLLLENQVKEKENAIQVLKKDNKMLLSIQRKQEKEINAKEELKLAWPHRITSLENDIRVYKEKLRKVRTRDIKFAATRKKQEREIEVLRQSNEKLKQQLENAIMPEAKRKQVRANRGCRGGASTYSLCS